ncbi:Uncharacterised protein [Mycobacteroides abscessus]|nr:Uncharacterised protein [Mycobacteroides abscessus]
MTTVAGPASTRLGIPAGWPMIASMSPTAGLAVATAVNP